MSQETKKAFSELKAKKLSETNNISFRDSFYKEGKYLLAILPKEVLDYLSHYPTGRENVIAFKKNINDKFGFKLNSIMQNVFSVVESIKKRNPESLGEALEKAVEDYNALPLEVKNSIDKNFMHHQVFHKAKSEWLQYGKIKLETIDLVRNVQVKIDGQVFSGKRTTRRGKPVVILTVPVEKVKHPAWNPLNHDYIAKLASDPFRVQKTEYDVVIGHDGHFYLMDGNHRFTLYSKPTVKVVVSDPIATDSLRVFFDLVNIAQPSKEQIVSIHRGELNPYDLIPPHLRFNVIFEN